MYKNSLTSPKHDSLQNPYEPLEFLDETRPLIQNLRIPSKNSKLYGFGPMVRFQSFGPSELGPEKPLLPGKYLEQCPVGNIEDITRPTVPYLALVNELVSWSRCGDEEQRKC